MSTYSTAPRRKAVVWPMLLAVAMAAACEGDPPSGPNPAAPGGAASTGSIDVYLVSDRSGFDVGVTIDGAGTWMLQPNDELSVQQLVPGQYMVRVTFLESARKAGLFCHVRDGTSRSVPVRAGFTTPVQYRIDCGTATGRPREREVE